MSKTKSGNSLLLHGPEVDIAPRILQNMRDNADRITLEYKTLAKLKEENFTFATDEHYDQITLSAHGTYAARHEAQASTHRDQHKVLLNETSNGIETTSEIISTASLLEICAKHTNQTFIDSCFAGAVMKDLQSADLSRMAVVAVEGSKYSTLTNPASRALEKEFLDNGTENLYDFAQINFPGTLGIRFADGSISKLSAAKIQDGKIKRHFSSPNPDVTASDKWWRKDREIIVDPESLSQQFKDVALGFSIIKEQKEQAEHWQRLGANVNAQYLEIAIFFWQILLAEELTQ